MTIVTSPIYELWDTETGDLIADYADEDSALRAVRAGVDDEGLAAWGMVELARVEQGGKRSPILRGATLAMRALQPLNVDPAAAQAAVMFVTTLADPAFRRAMVELRDELTRIVSETAADLDRVRAAARDLSRAGGVPVRVDREGPRVSLVTPNKTMAELLAIGASNAPATRDVPIRTVTDGYAVDIAA